MKKDMFKKIIVSLQLVFLIFSFFVSASHIFADIVCGKDQTIAPDGVSCISTTQENDLKYNFLAPLPCDSGEGCVGGELKTFDPAGDNKIGGYLNVMIRIFIGICAVLAVIMIVVGGLEYMTSELISNKENGKHRIRGAIFGLILALGAWTILNQINPDILNTDLKSLEKITVNVTLEDQIKSYTGQGACTPVVSGPCSPESLATAGFTDATQASKICNGESKGNPSLASGVDKCSDGNSFSFGLFQINVLAHANEIPGGVCSNIFQTNGGGTQGACLQRQGNICIKYDCSVKDSTKLQSCISYITNTANNIKYAAGLQTARGWGQWGANASCRF